MPVGDRAELDDGTVIELKRMPDGSLAWQSVDQGAQANRALGTARSALGGLTFGFADEAGNALAAGVAKLAGMAGAIPDAPIGDIYRSMRDQYQAEQGLFEEQNPGLAMTSEIAGGVGTGLGLARGAARLGLPALARTTMAQKHPLATSIAAGTGSGAVTGAGQAPTMESVPERAGVSAAAGAVGAVPAFWASNLMGRGLSGVANAVNAARSGGVSGRAGASRAVRTAAMRDDMTPAELVARQRAMGPEARLIDAGGENLVKVGEDVVTRPGRGANIANKFLTERQKASGRRLLSYVQREISKDGTFLRNVQEIDAERAAQAGPLYAVANQTRVDRGKLEGLVSWLKTEQRAAESTGIGSALRKVERMLHKSVPTRAGVSRSLKTKVGRELHTVKMELDDMIGKAFRAGEKNRARVLLKAQKRLLGVMDEASPEYKQARGIWADSEQIKGAMDLGRKLFKEDPEVLQWEFQRLSQADKDGFLIGAAKAIRDKLTPVKDRQDFAMRLAGSDDLRERLRPVFADDASYDRFMKDVATEERFTEVTNKLLRNSRTANRQAGRESIAQDVGEAGLSGQGVAGMTFAALRAVKSKLGRAVDVSEAELDQMTRLLFEATPNEAAVMLKRYGIPKVDVQPILDQIGLAGAVVEGQQAAGVVY